MAWASVDITIYRIRTCVKCYTDIAMSLGPEAFHAAGTLRNGKTDLHNYHTELVMTPWIFIYILSRQTPTEVGLPGWYRGFRQANYWLQWCSDGADIWKNSEDLEGKAFTIPYPSLEYRRQWYVTRFEVISEWLEPGQLKRKYDIHLQITQNKVCRTNIRISFSKRT
jgi:hypothetical protein